VHVFARVGDGQSFYELVGGVHYHRCPYLRLPDFVDDVNSMCRAFVERSAAFAIKFLVEQDSGPA